MASVAAELPQGAVARCRVGGLGKLLDGQDGGGGHEEDEADVERQVRDHEAQASRLGEHFVGRENARDRPQEARVGVVGAAACPSRTRPCRAAAGRPRCRPRPRRSRRQSCRCRRTSRSGTAVSGMQPAALQGLHRLVGDDDNHGRGRHGVVLQLRVIQRAGQCVLFAGDGHGGSGVQHGTGPRASPFPYCSPKRRCPPARVHGILALQRAGAVEVGQRHNGQVRRAYGAQSRPGAAPTGSAPVASAAATSGS